MKMCNDVSAIYCRVKVKGMLQTCSRMFENNVGNSRDVNYREFSSLIYK